MFCQNNKPDIFAYVSAPRVLMLVYYSMKAGTSTHVTISKVQLRKYRDADIHDNYEQKLFLYKIRPIPNIVLKPDFHTDSVRYQIHYSPTSMSS